MVQGFLHGQRVRVSSLVLSVLSFWWVLAVLGSPAYSIRNKPYPNWGLFADDDALPRAG